MTANVAEHASHDPAQANGPGAVTPEGILQLGLGFWEIGRAHV